MSPKNKVRVIRDRAQHAAEQLKPAAAQAAAQARPLAKSTGQAARRQFLRTRVWAAPRVERSGQVLQDTVAPKVSALLSGAARRIDPAQPRRRNWRKGVSLATVTAAGGAVAAYLRRRGKPGDSSGSTLPSDTAPATAPNGQAPAGQPADQAR